MATTRSEHPDGVLPFFMTDTAAAKYGMKTGDGIEDLIHRKTFNTADILKEIKTFGFMCGFEPCESYLKSCGLNEFVVVCDVASTFGEMFLLLYTKGAIDTFRSAAEQLEEEEISRQQNEIAKKEKEQREAQQARKNVVYVEKPIFPKQYNSATSELTEEEIDSLHLKQGRSPFATSIVISRSSQEKTTTCDDDFTLSSSIPFVKRDGEEEEYLDCRRQDTWTQIPQSTLESGSQTNWNRKVNKIIQYEPLSISDFGYDDEFILDDVCSFLRSVVPRMERTLQENETVDVHANYFLTSKDDSLTDFVIRDDDTMEEIRSFTDLEFSKEKLISAIDIHPTMKDVVAVSISEPLNIDEKIIHPCALKPSFIILWKFGEQMHPYRMLAAPMDCPVCKFNPTSPNVMVAGCDGGQVLMWNIGDENLPSVSSNGPQNEQKMQLSPVAMSSPDHSHKRVVADISWLPPNVQINARGQLLTKEYLTEVTYQFFTIAGDGQIIFWDTRFEDIMSGKLPHIVKVKSTKQAAGQNQLEWKPIFKIKPKRLSGTGELSLCKSLFHIKHEGPKSMILCSAEEGELLQVDWSPVMEQDTNGIKQEADFVLPEYVLWMKRDHNRPCVALSQHKYFPDFVLSVSDYNFHIWKTDSASTAPVFISPHESCHITGGEWSPTRPAVLFISKCNGSIDVWDFTESCYSPTCTYSLIPSKIISMKFIESADRGGQYLALGDNIGSLHIFQMPRNLVKSYSQEHDAMFSILDRFSKYQPLNVPESKLIKNHGDEENVSVVTADDSVDNTIASQNVQAMSDLNQGLTEEEEALYMELERKFLNS